MSQFRAEIKRSRKWKWDWVDRLSWGMRSEVDFITPFYYVILFGNCSDIHILWFNLWADEIRFRHSHDYITLARVWISFWKTAPRRFLNCAVPKHCFRKTIIKQNCLSVKCKRDNDAAGFCIPVIPTIPCDIIWFRQQAIDCKTYYCSTCRISWVT